MTFPSPDVLSSDPKRSVYHFPIRRPTAATMVVVTVMVFGLLSYRLLPLNLMPEISYPSLTVRTQYPGAAPEEVESAVSRPLEQALGVVRNLVEIWSSSRAELSDVVLEFNWGTDMNRATQDVREKLDAVFLPDEVKPPLILRYDPNLDPLMRIGLTCDTLSLLELRAIADDLVKSELEKLPGVAAVKTRGGEEVEIRVALDAGKLQQLGIPMAKVWQRLAADNVNVAGGQVQEGDAEFIVRALSEFRSVEEIAAVAIDVRDSRVVKLGDIAEVKRTGLEQTTITRLAGRESVELAIYKESDANPLRVSEAVRQRLFAKTTLPPGGFKLNLNFGGRSVAKRPLSISEMLTPRVGVEVLSDQAEFIKASLAEVRSSVIQGGALAVLVLWLFLGRISDTLIIAIVIPLSVVCTFAAMHLGKVTLNLMSLGGLALGVGMMVDNAIVVVESIFQRREAGDHPEAAAVRGTQLVAGAVIASTLTTIVVFFPLVFVRGIAGQVFNDLAASVTISLISSLLVALFYVPMLLTRTFNPPAPPRESEWEPGRLGFGTLWAEFMGNNRRLRFRPAWKLGLTPFIVVFAISRLILSTTALLAVRALLWGLGFGLRLFRRMARLVRAPASSGALLAERFRTGFSALKSAYQRALQKTLSHPVAWALGSLLFALAAFGLVLPQVGAELIPEVSQGMVDLELSLPVGTRLAQTAATTLPLEKALVETPGVRKVSSRIGGDLLSTEEGSRGPHNATISLLLEPGGNLERREAAVLERFRQLAAAITDLEAEVRHPTLFTLKAPLEVIIKSDDLNRLSDLSRRLSAELSRTPGFVEVRSSLHPGYPEVAVVFDRDRLARLGLTASDAAEGIRGAVWGRIPTRYNEAGKGVDIRVQYAHSDRDRLDDLRRLIINPGRPVPVALGDVAQLRLQEGPSEIRRVNATRCAVVSAGILGMDLKHADALVRGLLEREGLLPGVDFVIGGQRQEMDVSLRSLTYALLLSLFLVYVVMAAQFESLRLPIIILLTVPLALAGVTVMLWCVGFPLSVMVLLGFIVLAGIVVNNSIVLVDRAVQLIRNGLDVQTAILEAAATRLRPILMTSLTTILALIPVAAGLGEGMEMRRPMALTVIFGLTLSTLITLFIIPAFTYLSERRRLPGITSSPTEGSPDHDG